MSDTEPNRASSYSHKTDVVSESVALLTSKYADKAKCRALLASLIRPFQHIEDTAWDLISKSGIDTGEGAQLDQIGAVVGVVRGNLIDVEYRVILMSKIIALHSDGSSESLLKLAASLFGPSGFAYKQFSVATALISPESTLEIEGVLIDWDLIFSLFVTAKSAGVQLQLLEPASDREHSFQFASGDVIETDNNRGFADDPVSTLGGVMADIQHG